MSKSPARRARRQAQTYPPIRTFGDAISAAWGIHEQFGHACGCFVTTSDGEVVQGWVLTADWHTVDHVVDLALAVPDRELAGRRVIVVTAHGEEPRTVLAAEDVATWQRVADAVERRGARLVDWIQSGGEEFRSLHFSTDPGVEWDS